MLKLVLGLAVVSFLLAAGLFGLIVWRAYEHARGCHSNVVLTATGVDHYLVDGVSTAPADLPDILQRAAATAEKCLTLRIDGDDTFGHFNTLQTLAGPAGVRVTIESE